MLWSKKNKARNTQYELTQSFMNMYASYVNSFSHTLESASFPVGKVTDVETMKGVFDELFMLTLLTQHTDIENQVQTLVIWLVRSRVGVEMNLTTDRDKLLEYMKGYLGRCDEGVEDVRKNYSLDVIALTSLNLRVGLGVNDMDTDQVTDCLRRLITDIRNQFSNKEAIIAAANVLEVKP